MPSDHLSVPSTNNTTQVQSPNESDSALNFSELEGKSASEQLEFLNERLNVEVAIKDGAENLLNMKLNGTLRAKVESELRGAKNKIEAITQKIELESSRVQGQNVANNTSTIIPSPVSQRRRFAGQSPIPQGPSDGKTKDDKDDFQTALYHASTCIRALQALGRAASSPSSPFHNPSVSADLDRQRIELMRKLITVLRRNLRLRYELDLDLLVQVVIPGLADKSSTQCRAATYRVLRHALVDGTSVKRLDEHFYHWYIVKSLVRDNKHAVEKEQAIKLVRAIVEIGSKTKNAKGECSVPIQESIMRAIIAVAEHPEDPFRPICIQTLAEIMLVDIKLVAKTDGLHVLLHVLGEGTTEMAMVLTHAFLHIVDNPRTRSYLHLGFDLEIALSPITDAPGKGVDHAERMRACTSILRLMLRTWSGLMYFCMNDMLAIRSVIRTLYIPTLETREVVLDMVFDLLNIKSPDWFQTFISGRRLTMYRRSQNGTIDRTVDADVVDRAHQLKLTDQYVALLIIILYNAGLLDALTSMIRETTTGSNLSRKATLLMAEVLQIANRVLPLSIAAKIQAIPNVFELAADYEGDKEHRIIGTMALSAIDSFNRNRLRLQPSAQKDTRPRANSVEDAVRRGQRQVEQVKIKMGMQMDDKVFQATLLDTQVMLTKDSSRWSFETLQDLIEGPLLNPKRMEEAIKVSRFIRRLMSFFHPFSYRFSDMPRTKSNMKWVKLGCTLITTLLSSPDGIRYLQTEDALLSQIVKGFAQLDPFKPDQNPLFSEKRIGTTLTYGYFEMLGTLSKHKEGIELMERFKVFTALYHITELRSREDLVIGIIEKLDYTIDGHQRIVLSKALTSSYKEVRLHTTRHLGELIRNSATVNAWTLRLLLTQLYDPAPAVYELAVHYLEELCESQDILQLVVEMQPSMDHLGDIGHPLLMKFMSTPTGFRYLYDAGYIDREMDMWLNERNIYYVVQVEVFLTKAFTQGTEDDEDLLTFEGTVPSHFYGELSKTELGYEVLLEKGHFADFALFIRQHGLESEDDDLILKLKSVLWAVGNIGATEGGLTILEEEEIIPVILEIAESSPVASVRGTCFFVLGLISSTSQGAEILDDFRWEATLNPLGFPTGLCVPLDVEKFTTLPPWKPVEMQSKIDTRLPPPNEQAEIEVMTCLQNLSNTVIANAASRSLAKMKSRPEYRGIFTSPVMYYRILHMISSHRYRLPVRRYILELFNLDLNVDVVQSIEHAGKRIQASVPSSYPKPAQLTRVVSMFGGRPRRGSESGDEEEVLSFFSPTKDAAAPLADKHHHPVPLAPVKKVVGFEPDSD